VSVESVSHMRIRQVIAFLILFLGLQIGSTYGQLVTDIATWTGGSGNWSDAANWSTNPVVPNNYFPIWGNNCPCAVYNVTIDTPGAVVSMDVSNVRIYPLTLGATSSLNVNNGSFFGLDGGGLVSGTLTNNGVAINDGTLTNNFGGTFTNNGGFDNTTGVMHNYGTITNNLGGTFIDAGNFFNNAGGVFDNDGFLDNSRGTNGGVINNSGTLNNSGAELTNSGTVNNTGQINSSATFQNSGAVTISGTGLFTTSTNYTQTAGHTIVDGTLTATGSAIVNIQGGTLGGTGTINGNVEMAGTMMPGAPGTPGSLVIFGNYEQKDTGILEELIGPYSHSFLDVSGNVSLDSGALLDITLLDGYDPLNQTFSIMDFAFLNGQFANGSSFWDDGYLWDITHRQHEVDAPEPSSASRLLSSGGTGPSRTRKRTDRSPWHPGSSVCS
jgi:hypothetical protein